MKTLGAFLTTLFFATAAFAAVQSTKVKIKMADIAEIVESNPKANSLMVKTHDGRKYRLKLSAEQIEELKGQLASNDDKVALQAAASATTAATSGATTSTKVEDIVKEEKKSKWSFAHIMVTLAGVEKLHDGEGTLTFLQLPSIGYKLNNGIKLGLIPGFIMNYDLGRSVSASDDLLDWQLTVAKGGFKLPADIGMSLKGRYYLPTGATSRKNEAIGTLRLTANFSKKFNSLLSLGYSADPRYYLQTKASTFAEDDFGRITGDATSTTGFRYTHGLTLTETISDSFSLSQSLGLDHFFKNADEGVNASGDGRTNLELDLGLSYGAANWLSLSFGINQSHNLSGDEEFSLFNTAQMTYILTSVFIF